MNEWMNKCVWNISGMIVTGENKNIQRTPCCCTILFITTPTQTGLGLNLGLQSEWPAINCLSYGMVYIVMLIHMCMISLLFGMAHFLFLIKLGVGKLFFFAIDVTSTRNSEKVIGLKFILWYSVLLQWVFL
jgi:Alpha-glucuronidase